MLEREAGKIARRARAKALYPNATPSELDDHVRRSYYGHTPEAIARQRGGLRVGARPGAISRRRKPAAPRTDPAKLDILDFSAALNVTLHPGQRVILKSLYGLVLDSEELEIYSQLTGGLTQQHEIGREALEAVLVLGARSGKSLLASIVALYESIARGHVWRRYLQPKERGYCIITATRQAQAEAIILGNAGRLLQNSELSGHLAEEPLQTEIRLKNDLVILALPCNSTAGRGHPIYTLILDEVGHFRSEGVSCDQTIYDSLSPRLAQFRGAKTLLLSTASAKQGLLWTWFNEGFQVSRRGTFQGDTTLVNPNVDPEYLERMKARDPEAFAREFGAQFCERMSAYFGADTVDAALILCGDQPARDGVTYHLGIDQSGLSGRDRFSAAVAHREEDGAVVLDVLRSWDSTDAHLILRELSEVAKAYRITTALLDQYGAGWVRTALAGIGLETETRPGLPQVYSNTRSLMLAGKLRAPMSGELWDGFVGTIGYYGKNNSLSIGHERNLQGHGDLADATATAAWAASGRGETLQRAFSDADILAALGKGQTRAIV